MKRAFKKTGRLFVTYSFGNLAQNILSIFLIPLYTSILTPKDYGILALMTLTVTLMIIAISAPLISALNRFYYHPNYEYRNGLLLFNLFLLIVIKAALLSIIFLIVSPLVCRVLFDGETLISLVKLYTFVLFLTPISNFLTSHLRLKEKARFFVAVSIFKLALSLVVILYGLLVLKIGIYAPVLGTIVGLGAEIVMSLRVLVCKSTLVPSLSILREPLRYGYALIISGYSNLAIQSGDRYVLRVFDSLGTIGVYSLGYTIASAINTLVVNPLKQSLLPVVLRQEKNSAEQKLFLKSAAVLYYFGGTLMALGLSLFAKEVIMLVARKPEFWYAWVIVPIISFSYIQHGLGLFLSWGLVMKNKSYQMSINLLISAAINIGLNFVFIPLWGIIGAAFATLISYIAWNGLKIYYSAKFYDLHFDLWRLGHITAVGLGLYLVSSAIVNTGSMPLDLGIKFLILLTYPLLFLITGFFKDNELDYMRQLWGSVRKIGIRETYARIRAM